MMSTLFPVAALVACAKPLATPVARLEVTTPADAGAIEVEPAVWEPGPGERSWVLRGGKMGAPLVVRGIIQPSSAYGDMAACEGMQGARHGTKPVVLRIEGPARTLYVFAKARGPIGIARPQRDCAVAGANRWAKLVADEASEDVTIAIADVDAEGERRGQTSPFVLVVTDEDKEPTLEPDERVRPSATDLLVRWAVKPRACPQGMEFFTCMDAAIEVADAAGKAMKTVPLKKPLAGQLGCWPQGTGATCNGPSGGTDIALQQDGSGNVKVVASSYSDGYCPPPDDCTSRETLGTFAVPRGAKLVPDPAGVWPPAER